MDLNNLNEGIESARNAVTLIKELFSLLPTNDKKELIEKKLTDAELSFELAIAKTSKELGYELCYCSNPPQIMLLPNSGPKSEWECSKCGRKTNLHRNLNIPTSGNI